jgi:hypothetical protein
MCPQFFSQNSRGARAPVPHSYSDATEPISMLRSQQALLAVHHASRRIADRIQLPESSTFFIFLRHETLRHNISAPLRENKRPRLLAINNEIRVPKRR